jgi:hypothetical protein
MAPSFTPSTYDHRQKNSVTLREASLELVALVYSLDEKLVRHWQAKISKIADARMLPQSHKHEADERVVLIWPSCLLFASHACGERTIDSASV